jgi:site-specific recombinase XerD
MSDKIAEWVDWLSITASPLTAAGYQWQLRRLEQAFPGIDVLSLKQADLVHYLANRRAIDRVGNAAIKNGVNAFKSFYKYAQRSRSIARSLTSPPVKKKLQRTLTGEQAMAVMAACDTSKARGKRDLAIVCLLLDTGLRESEVCRLKLSDVNMAARALTVQIKGGADGGGVFSLNTAAILGSWLALRAVHAAPGVDTFFVSIGGNHRGTPLTPAGLRCIFRSMGKAAGLAHFSPHDLRRTFAVLASRNGAPSRIVQVAGRWDDLKMVEWYTQALEAKDIDPYLPVSNLLAMR